MKYLLSFFALILSFSSFGQVAITDVASCTAYTLTATVTGITPTDIGLYSDDDYSNVKNIGFTFNFYGTPYTQLVIGENGMATFNTSLAGGSCPWPISAALLGNSSALNSICGPWCDIDGTAATQPIYASLQGIAPNRTYAITWCGVYMFDCTTQWTTSQIILYESSNVVEVHIGHKTICTTWNGGYGICGLQNAAGTAATTAPGRDYPSTWNATNEAWRFTPVGGTSYTVASIPYGPIPYASSTIYWYNATTGAYIGTGATQVVTPTTTTTYRAAAVGCNDTSFATITLGPAGGSGAGGTSVASFTASKHLGCNGDTVILTNTSTPPGFFYYWNFGDGTLVDSTIPDPVHIYSDQGTYTGAYTIVLTYNTTHDPACASTYTVPVTFDHPVSASFTPSAYKVCIGTPVDLINNSIPLGSPGGSYQWTFGDGKTSSAQNPSDTFATGGVYSVGLTVTDTVGCKAYTSATIDVVHIDVQTMFHDTSLCLAIPLILYTHTDTAGSFDSVTYLWTPSVNLNNATTPEPSFWGTGNYTYTVQATAWPLLCEATDTVTIHSFPPPALTNLTASPQTIPYGGSIQLNVDGALYYYWFPDNGTLNNPNLNNPVATPTDSITTYTVFGMTAFGCRDSAKVVVNLDNTMGVNIPSAFTPNNDGLNDFFRVSNLTYQKLVDMRVYNRWGVLIYQTADAARGWDGTYQGVLQDMGVYTYQVILANVDGTQKVYKGNVTLIR